jgi:transposase
MFSKLKSLRGNTCALGEFRRKVRSAGAHALEIEPYSPWLNRAETAIKALKRMTNTAMTK